MSRVTLIFATTVFLPELPGGFRRLFHYAPGLSERGIDMKVVTFPSEEGGKVRLKENTIEIIFVEEKGEDEVSQRVHLNEKAIEEAKANLQNGKQIVFPIGINAAIARSLRRAKKDGIRAMTFVTNAPELPTTWFSALRQRMGASLWMSAFDRLIFCSQGQKELFCRTCWIPDGKAIAIPNGVNTDRFHPADEAEKCRLRGQFGLNDQDFVFVYTGNIIPRKNTDFLLRAWKGVCENYPNAKLLLVGNRAAPKTFRFESDLKEYQEFQARMEEAIDALEEFTGSIRFPGPQENIEDWLRASDVFVFPSLREGLPNSLLEAMACGLPCLSSPFSSFPNDGEELGSVEKEFILVPFEEEKWTEAMLDMLESPGKRNRLGEAASKWITKYHGYDSILDRFAELYHAS